MKIRSLKQDPLMDPVQQASAPAVQPDATVLPTIYVDSTGCGELDNNNRKRRPAATREAR